MGPGKFAIYQDLVRLHEDALAESEDVISRNKNSETFAKAVAEETVLAARIRTILAQLKGQEDLFRTPAKTVGVGSLVSVHYSEGHAPERKILLAEDTVIDFFKRGHGDLLAMPLKNFKLRKVGEVEKYMTGRPGEEFEVSVTLEGIE